MDETAEQLMGDRWFSVEKFTEYLGISKDTVYTWMFTRDMPGHKVGRLWKYKTSEIDEWIRVGGASPAERVEIKS